VANQTPLSGLSDAAGGILLPPAQGESPDQRPVLQESGAIALAGDSRTTSSRKEAFPIFNGLPTAEFVGEGGTKPVTGAEFSGGTLNIKKVASIITFTDEMLEDVQNGDFNVLVDTGVRKAIANIADANAIGKDRWHQHLDQLRLGVSQHHVDRGVGQHQSRMVSPPLSRPRWARWKPPVTTTSGFSSRVTPPVLCAMPVRFTAEAPPARWRRLRASMCR
jgi:hypothetical protein